MRRAPRPLRDIARSRVGQRVTIARHEEAHAQLVLMAVLLAVSASALTLAVGCAKTVDAAEAEVVRNYAKGLPAVLAAQTSTAYGRTRLRTMWIRCDSTSSCRPRSARSASKPA